MSPLLSRLHPVAPQYCKIAASRAVGSRSYSSFYPKIRVEKKVTHQRSLKTSKHRNSRHDESPIDFAYMPREQFFPTEEPDSLRVPLLPDNYAPPLEHTNNAHYDVHMESVAKPTISTVSANGTHIDNPSAMSDVTDNHSQDMDVFGLTQKVSAAAASKASAIGNTLREETEHQQNSFLNLWYGLVDDVLGPRRTGRT